jgi:hypothetical protein
MESPLPIVDQEFFFAETCLPSRSIATDIHVKYISGNEISPRLITVLK